MVSQIKPANDIISQSILSGLLSKHTPHSVRKLLQYQTMIIAEASLGKARFQHMMKAMLTMASVEMSTQGIICSEKFEKKFRYELHLPWGPFTLDPFKRLIRICLAIVFLAFIVLIIEYSYHKMCASGKKPKLKSVSQKVTYRMQDTRL